MKSSVRARRMQRHYGRMKKPGGLNLTALMDIFTILVFFLMVNSSDVQVLQEDRDIHLPESVADTTPEDTLRVVVAGQSILVQGREVARVDGEGWPESDGLVGGLNEELERLAERRQEIPEAGLPAMVVADRDLPYEVLRPIMRTAVDAGFRQLHLAVEAQPLEVDGDAN